MRVLEVREALHSTVLIDPTDDLVTCIDLGKVAARGQAVHRSVRHRERAIHLQGGDIVVVPLCGDVAPTAFHRLACVVLDVVDGPGRKRRCHVDLVRPRGGDGVVVGHVVIERSNTNRVPGTPLFVVAPQELGRTQVERVAQVSRKSREPPSRSDGSAHSSAGRTTSDVEVDVPARRTRRRGIEDLIVVPARPEVIGRENRRRTRPESSRELSEAQNFTTIFVEDDGAIRAPNGRESFGLFERIPAEPDVAEVVPTRRGNEITIHVEDQAPLSEGTPRRIAAVEPRLVVRAVHSALVGALHTLDHQEQLVGGGRSHEMRRLGAAREEIVVEVPVDRGLPDHRSSDQLTPGLTVRGAVQENLVDSIGAVGIGFVGESRDSHHQALRGPTRKELTNHAGLLGTAVGEGGQIPLIENLHPRTPFSGILRLRFSSEEQGGEGHTGQNMRVHRASVAQAFYSVSSPSAGIIMGK